MRLFYITIALIVLLAVSGSVAADDMWSETPDLENLAVPSFAVESHRWSKKRPGVDRWAETPDWDDDNERNIEIPKQSVIRHHPAHPDMYAETPNLTTIPPHRRNSAAEGDRGSTEVLLSGDADE